MTVPAPRVRRRPSAAGRALPLLLVVALLAPLALLFVQTWRLTDADRDLVVSERLGVEYLRALAPVTDALVEAQSAAVAGRPVSGEDLNRAVEAVAAVDARIGDELRSQERWAGLRAKLEALSGRSPGNPEAAYAAFGEATDLLLDLHRKVQETSGLIRDPESASFFLQHGIGTDLPQAVIAVGRLADLTVLAGTRPAAQRARTVAELAGARVAALAPSADMVTDLRAAVDSSESTDLGSNVLNPLDTYQRAVEALAAYSLPATPNGKVDVGQLVAARTAVQNAAKQLQPVILGKLDALLAERLDRLDRERRLALGAAATGVLLVAALVAIGVGAARRARHRAAQTRAAAASEDSGALPSARWQGPPGRPAEPRPLQSAGSGRRAESSQWGPFDAAR